MPLAVAGHTASLTASGNVLVTGGARTIGGPAVDNVQVFSRSSGQFNALENGLLSPRVGHTATVLDDGRILIVGGGTREEIAGTGELVESVEIFSPESGMSTAISVVGDPIRRMYHTASYRITDDGLTVDLIGGTGDVQYAPSPELGVRRDMRSFLFRSDTLYALSPAIGPFIEPMTGHSQTPLRSFSPGEAASFLVTGFSYDPQPLPISMLVDFTSPFGVEVRGLAARRFPSAHHAAEQLGRSVVGLFGGVDASNESTGAAEIYYGEIDRVFTLPADVSNSLFPRFGHTATFIGSNRILVIGGFSDNAAANGRALIFSYSL
jgi:hypothetical protein